MRRVDAAVAHASDHVEWIGDPHTRRHVEHGAGGMEGGVSGRKPVATGVNHAKPVWSKGVGVAGEQFVGRPEDHTFRGQRRIELVANDVTIHRGQTAGQFPTGSRSSSGAGRRVLRRKRCLCPVEVGVGIGRQVARENRGGEEALGDSHRRRGRTRTPGLGLEEPNIRPHPVLVAAIRQAERHESVERGAADVARPRRQRRRGDDPFKKGRVERGSWRGRGGAHGFGQPTEPSICSSISRFISTAYSMGSSLTSGSMNPPTIIVLASASVRPRLIR